MDVRPQNELIKYMKISLSLRISGHTGLKKRKVKNFFLTTTKIYITFCSKTGGEKRI